MVRRRPEEYDWERLEFDETILTKHFTAHGSPRQIEFVAIHHMASVGYGNGSANDGAYRTWQSRQASAHYGVDGKHVRQFVWDKDVAWSLGNWPANTKSISIEHANASGAPSWKVSAATMLTGARLVAHLHKLYGLGRPVKDRTVRRHRDFTSTACPGPYLGGTEWSDYVAEAQRVYDSLTSNPPAPGKPTDQPRPPATYVVRPGDTLSKIADRFGVTVAKLAKWNGITDPNRIEVGTQLHVTKPAGQTPPPAPVPPKPVKLPEGKVTLPVGEEDHPKELDPPYPFPPYFVETARGWRFRALVDGVTTSGSEYPRSEWREKLRGKLAAWSTRKGKHRTHILRGVCEITELPKGTPSGTFAQFHDKADDVVMLRIDGTDIYLYESLGKGKDRKHHLIGGYRSGALRFELEASPSGITATVNGVRKHIDRQVDGGYAKFGAYSQANEDNGRGAFQVDFIGTPEMIHR